MTLKLYGGVRSRAAIVQWYLEELGIPYEFVLLDMQSGEHLQPDYLKINPLGKVPAIVDGEFPLWESGAILVYLAQKYGNGGKSPEEEATLVQWVLFANATFGPGIFIESNRDRELGRLMKPLNQIFGTQTFLVGQDFTVADVAVGSMLAYTQMMLNLDLGEYPAVVEYIKRISDRPAFQKTIGSRS